MKAFLLFAFMPLMSFAQIGMSFEEATKLPNTTGLKTYKQYGEEFVKLTTEDDKGLVLEMEFLNDRCESARWVLRKGKLPNDFAKEVWKENFKNEEFVKKGGDTWLGKTGGLLTQTQTKSGQDVIWVRSSKMDKVMDAEAVRVVERKTGQKIDQEALDKIKVINQKKNVAEERSKPRQVYNDKGDWVGSIRNGQLYGTDASWKGSVLNEQIYDADLKWRGSINNNGSVSSPDGGWIGTAR